MNILKEYITLKKITISIHLLLSLCLMILFYKMTNFLFVKITVNTLQHPVLFCLFLVYPIFNAMLAVVSLFYHGHKRAMAILNNKEYEKPSVSWIIGMMMGSNFIIKGIRDKMCLWVLNSFLPKNKRLNNHTQYLGFYYTVQDLSYSYKNIKLASITYFNSNKSKSFEKNTIKEIEEGLNSSYVENFVAESILEEISQSSRRLNV